MFSLWFYLWQHRTTIAHSALFLSLAANFVLLVRLENITDANNQRLGTAIENIHRSLGSFLYLVNDPNTNWNDPATRIAIYNSLNQVAHDAVIANRYQDVTSGQVSQVAQQLGQFAWILTSRGKDAPEGYVSIAEKIVLTGGSVVPDDQTALQNFARELQQLPWPFEPAGWDVSDSALQPLNQALQKLLADQCIERCYEY